MEVFFYAIIGYPIVTQVGEKHKNKFISKIKVEIEEKSRRGLNNSKI